jgi:hypothetical protein
VHAEHDSLSYPHLRRNVWTAIKVKFHLRSKVFLRTQSRIRFSCADSSGVLSSSTWFVLQFISGVTTLGAVTQDGVAWWAHIGGFLLGIMVTTVARQWQQTPA